MEEHDLVDQPLEAEGGLVTAHGGPGIRADLQPLLGIPGDEARPGLGTHQAAVQVEEEAVVAGKDPRQVVPGPVEPLLARHGHQLLFRPHAPAGRAGLQVQ